MNILTFDVEEWFHLLDFDATRNEDQWGHYEVRIYENVDRILRLLDETNSKATFFIIGWIAKNYPDLVRKIADKYQIGSHTLTHQLVWQQSKNAFRQDVDRSVKLLEDITGKEITAFRAPGFSIRKSESWAFEILAELGITTDCSVFPAKHAHGGMPEVNVNGPLLIEYNGITMREFPITTRSILGKHIVFSGGGYFRLFPYSLIREWTNSADYLMTYIHPRDLDSGQPVLPGLPLIRRFKSYVGLKGAEHKLRKYLHNYNFIDVRTAEQEIDWTKIPVLSL